MPGHSSGILVQLWGAQFYGLCHISAAERAWGGVLEHPQVRASFRPEFVNRVDEFVVFEGLRLEQIRQIVRLQAKRVEQRLADQKIHLQLTDAAVDYLAVRAPALPWRSLLTASRCGSSSNGCRGHRCTEMGVDAVCAFMRLRYGQLSGPGRAPSWASLLGVEGPGSCACCCQCGSCCRTPSPAAHCARLGP